MLSKHHCVALNIPAGVTALLVFSLLAPAAPSGHNLQIGNMIDQSYNEKMGQRDDLTKAQIAQLLREGKQQGYLTADHLDDSVVLGQVADSISSDVEYSHHDDHPTATGSQELVLYPSPFGGKSVQPLATYFEGPEWSALFEEALGCTFVERLSIDETYEHWQQRQMIHIKESIPEYPLVARIWSIDTDVSYGYDEISDLKRECLRLLSSISDTRARKGLEKLISGCDLASKRGMSLSLLAE